MESLIDVNKLGPRRDSYPVKPLSEKKNEQVDLFRMSNQLGGASPVDLDPGRPLSEMVQETSNSEMPTSYAKVPPVALPDSDKIPDGPRTGSISSSPRRSISTMRRRSTFNFSTGLKQKLTDQEKKVIATFSSVNYSPTDSHLYEEWLREHPPRAGWDRWLMMLLIGLTTGLTAVLLRQCLTALDRFKWTRARELALEGDFGHLWGWVAGISVLFVFFGSVLIAFVYPPAAGPGVPEVISYLNGIMVHGSWSLKYFVVKFVGNVLAVSSGIPCAIQGPIIALGSVIGAGVGQFRSKSLNINPKLFSRFRNPEDRRNFTTAGVAAGVSAAFNAPIGGLMFAMEDISSFWSKKLSWMTFLCCGIAAGTANLFNTAFSGFVFQGQFGLFNLWVIDPVQIHILIFLPCIVLGLVGGFMGALYTKVNITMQKTRKRLLAKIKNPTLMKTVRVGETIFITLLMSTVVVTLPMGFPCEDSMVLNQNITNRLRSCGVGENVSLEVFDCGRNTTTYNQVATLLVGSGQSLLNKLVSRNTHRIFGYASLLAVLPIYFFLMMWTAGSAIAGGIFIPSMVTGALYGRVMGLIIIDIYRAVTGNEIPLDDRWGWMDPGAMAMIGAGSLLGGITRLTLAVTIIVVEMAQDVDFIIPVMAAIFVAKLVADVLCRPLYKCLLDFKGMPFLDPEPGVVLKEEVVNLELYQAKDVMVSPVRCIKSVETVAFLARLLRDSDHGGFPVVKFDDETRTEVVCGMVTRNELYVILLQDSIYNADQDGVVPLQVKYEDISIDYIADPSAAMERVKTFCKFSQYQNMKINLEPYVNRSAMKIDEEYSLYRTYMIFRTMGLRHLMVIDKRNRLVGMITRKDLLSYRVTERLAAKEEEEQDMEIGSNTDSEVCIIPAVTVGNQKEVIRVVPDGSLSNESRDSISRNTKL